MFGIDAQRIAAFAKSPLDNPLSRSEQMELARLFLHIQKQADIFNNMPNQPILDGHIQMVTSRWSLTVMRKAGLQSSPAQLHTSWRKRFKSFEKPVSNRSLPKPQ